MANCTHQWAKRADWLVCAFCHQAACREGMSEPIRPTETYLAGRIFYYQGWLVERHIAQEVWSFLWNNGTVYRFAVANSLESAYKRFICQKR
jgi:hypothetical protein